MSVHREAHLEMCAALVLGALDEADRLELEAHRAAGCPVCEREIARLEEAAGLLAASVASVSPPASLKARTLAAVAAVRRDTPSPAGRIVELPRRRANPWIPRVLAAAASVLAVMAIAFRQQAERLRGELSDVQQQLAQSERELQDERRWSAVLGALEARTVQLTPTPDGPADLRGRGTWDPKTGRAVIVFEHVVAPTGRDYELWGLHPSGAKSLGLVRPDSSGRAIVRLEDAGDSATLQAFAISLEPAGGSGNPNAPSGPVVMLGRIGGSSEP